MRVLLLFFWMGLFGITHAQKYPILHYTTQDGLSQMQVMSTFKDSKGYLWVGTKYGFCKFNGESFERFPPDFKVVGMEVNEFAEDSNTVIPAAVGRNPVSRSISTTGDHFDAVGLLTGGKAPCA